LFPEEKLSEIRERLPIVEFISEHVQLKKAGKHFKGLCPFHSEKSPSFTVSEERESFHCFGCATGGNIFHFLMKLEGLTFPEAVIRLAERSGVEVESHGASDPEATKRRTRSFELQRQAAWYYHCLLKKTPSDDPVWEYLTKRQIDAAAIEAFHLGYCPNSDSGLRTHLLKKEFTNEEIEACSLYRGTREFFRGRLLFPIFTQNKKVVGMGGRLFLEKDRGPKYLNSPESEVFKKGELFYGLHLGKEAIRKKDQAIVVEGYLDVISMHRYGFDQAIAPLGTAFTPLHAKTLKRLCQEVVLIFDGDNAGKDASIRALEALLSHGAVPTFVAMDSSEDPDSFLKRYGRLAFEKKLQERRNLLQELIDKTSAEIPAGPANLEKKGEAARRILALLEKIPDSIVQNLYRRRVSEALEIPEDWLNKSSARPIPASKAPAPAPTKIARWLPEEETIFEIWLKCPELRPEVAQEVALEDFCSEGARETAERFFQMTDSKVHGMTGQYFDLAPPGTLEVLSELALRPNGLEEPRLAHTSLEEALLRLREKRLRKELHSLKRSDDPEQMGLLQEKIHALSQVMKTKERVYGERKN